MKVGWPKEIRMKSSTIIKMTIIKNVLPLNSAPLSEPGESRKRFPGARDRPGFYATLIPLNHTRHGASCGQRPSAHAPGSRFDNRRGASAGGTGGPFSPIMGVRACPSWARYALCASEEGSEDPILVGYAPPGRGFPESPSQVHQEPEPRTCSPTPFFVARYGVSRRSHLSQEKTPLRTRYE